MNNSIVPFKNLCPDELFQVFSFLEPEELALRSSLTCKLFKEIIDSNEQLFTAEAWEAKKLYKECCQIALSNTEAGQFIGSDNQGMFLKNLEKLKLQIDKALGERKKIKNRYLAIKNDPIFQAFGGYTKFLKIPQFSTNLQLNFQSRVDKMNVAIIRGTSKDGEIFFILKGRINGFGYEGQAFCFYNDGVESDWYSHSSNFIEENFSLVRLWKDDIKLKKYQDLLIKLIKEGVCEYQSEKLENYEKKICLFGTKQDKQELFRKVKYKTTDVEDFNNPHIPFSKYVDLLKVGKAELIE